MKTAALGILAIILAGIAFALYDAFKDYRPVAAAPETPTAQLSSKSIEEDTLDYTISVSYPAFGIPRVDAEVERMVQDIVAAFRSQAADDQPAAEGLRKYMLDGQYDRAYMGSDYVSARLQMYQDFGGAHGLPFVVGLNFDPNSGRELTLDDMLRETGLTLEEIARQSLAQVRAQLGDDALFPEGADPKPENYSTFLIDEDSVTFIFQAYQVAPYAAGMPEVEFPRQ